MPRLVRFVLRLMPADFRERFGEEIVTLLDRRSRELRGSQRRIGLLRFWLYHTVDIIRTAVSERHAERRQLAVHPSSKRDTHMASLIRDFSQAARTFRRNRIFATVAVLTLAIGIGANATVFSVVNGILLRPLPYHDAQRLVTVWSELPGFGFETFSGLAEDQFVHYRARTQTLESLAAWGSSPARMRAEGRPELIDGAAISENLLGTMGVSPAMGRGFTAEETLPGTQDVAIISHGLWTSRFGSDPNIIGTVISLDERQTEIVGVMPVDFRFVSSSVELWRPLQIDHDSLTSTSFSLQALGRLRPNVTHEDATREFMGLIKTLPETNPGSFFTVPTMEQAGLKPTVHLLLEDIVGSIRSALWILLGTVGLVMLIACANVANLFLVRAESRQKEVAVRVALGANRTNVARLFLAESMLLGIVAGILGLGVAYGGTRLLVALSPEQLPRLQDIRIDGMVITFTLGISVLSGLLFGVFPALRYSKPEVGSTLQQEGRSGAITRERQRIRGGLVVIQIALALVLLIGSGLMVRSLVSLSRVDPGFESEGILTFRLALPPSQYDTATTIFSFYQQLLERVGGLPGVNAVGASTQLPLYIGSGVMIRPEGVEINPNEIPPIIFNSSVTSDFFRTVGIPIFAGRSFERTDLGGPSGAGAAVVSRGFVEQFWPGENAIGKRFQRGDGTPPNPWFTIVGVVGDVRGLGLREDPVAQVYFPFAGATPSLAVSVSTSGDPTQLAPVVRRAVWALDPNIPVTGIRTMEDLLTDSTASTMFTMTLLTVASAVALLLGTVGIYGVVTYVVSQRTREIGVRIALGAKQQDVRRMVLRQGGFVVVIGVVAGLAAATGITRLMESLLFEVNAMDPVTFLVATGFIIAVSLLASMVPARRAARIDPIEALRAE